MQLNHEFTVDAPLEQVWQAMLDPRRVAPCMPGAALSSVDGDEFAATVQVKLGPISLKYKGKGEYVEKDEQAKRLVIKADGKDVRGAGTASGSATVTLSEVDGKTHGDVRSDLKVTGRPAQFGRGLISEVGGRLLGEFASNLAKELGEPEQAAPAPEAAGAGAQPGQQAAGTREPPEQIRPSRDEPEALDLISVAGMPMLKRLAPALAVLAAVIAIVVLRRSRQE